MRAENAEAPWRGLEDRTLCGRFSTLGVAFLRCVPTFLLFWWSKLKALRHERALSYTHTPVSEVEHLSLDLTRVTSIFASICCLTRYLDLCHGHPLPVVLSSYHCNTFCLLDILSSLYPICHSDRCSTLSVLMPRIFITSSLMSFSLGPW